jgi:hypothetical protein
MSMTPENPWTPQDEGDHSPVLKEWWTVELLFDSPENHKHWNLMITMAYEHDTPSCFFQYVLFDMSLKKCVLDKDINDDITKFHHVKNTLDLRYEQSSLTGAYPSYHLHVQDDEKGLLVDIDFQARSLPHWIAQDVTSGNLPIGLNYYRYGFLPHCDVKGTMTFQGTPMEVKGKGYLEHAWGNWSYTNPLQMLAGIRKTMKTYAHLSRWWLSHHNISFPNCIEFTSENNLFGYDWAWGICENNWSMFYGNSLLWVSEGPSFGSLCVTPDGNQYWEFCNLHFKYNRMLYLKPYDIFYPLELELRGRLEDKTIHLRFISTTENYEYIDPRTKSRFYNAFILSGLPGIVEGTFTDREKTVPLKGECKMTALRQVPKLGHNAIQFSFLKPPQGIGMTIVVDSHYLKKQVVKVCQLAPRPRLHWKITDIDLSAIPKETKKQ